MTVFKKNSSGEISASQAVMVSFKISDVKANLKFSTRVLSIQFDENMEKLFLPCVLGQNAYGDREAKLRSGICFP